MSVPNWIAVFKAEYFTTTAKFRAYRRWIPLVFFILVIFFSYFIRAALNFVSRSSVVVTSSSLSRFYAIISIFSFFTLFSPLISPLSRSVYDGSSNSRRDISMSSPLKPHELLYGNLASNLVFYLPFYVMVGTVSLSVFIGSAEVDPIISSLYIFSSLFLLVLLGLFGGTILTPLVYNFISGQRNEIARAVVTLFMSFMLMLSLPLLQYMISSLENRGSLGYLSFLPFTLAASIIVFGLYGETIGTSVSLSLVLLVLYNILIIILGFILADRLYSTKESLITESKPDRLGLIELFGVSASKLIPDRSVRVIFLSMVRSTVRDIEHMSRLTIGVAATMFFVYALSPRGLFQGNRSFSGELENAAVLFALILSASTNIYVEASSFVVQHKSMLSIIKSSPNGSRKFVVAKFLQMLFIQIPIFILVLVVLQILNFSSAVNLWWITLELIVIIIGLTGTILGIYLINPADNEEDITNFINLLIFYSFGLLVAVFPVAGVIGFEFPLYVTGIYFLGIFLFGILCMYVGIKALDLMDVETLSSTYSKKIVAGFSGFLISIISWNLIPTPAFLLYFLTTNALLLIVLSVTLPLVVPALYWWKHQNLEVFGTFFANYRLIVFSYLLLLMSGIGISVLFTQLQLSPSFDIISNLVTRGVKIELIASYIVLLSIAEEIFFRGFLIDYLSNHKFTSKQILLVSSLIFAFFHITSLPSFLIGIVGGYILGNLRLKSNGLFSPLLVHVAYNLSLFLLSI